MKIIADKEGQQLLLAVADAALKKDGMQAFPVVTAMNQNTTAFVDGLICPDCGKLLVKTTHDIRVESSKDNHEWQTVPCYVCSCTTTT